MLKIINLNRKNNSRLK